MYNIKGLGTFENGKCMLNLNFADDTLIILKADCKMTEALKLLLIGFEQLSGLKINFFKSEMIPLNLDDLERVNLASILECKTSNLPITYLGILLQWRRLKMEEWDIVINKIQNKLDN